MDIKLKDKNTRRILHNKHTKFEHGFNGTWSSIGGIIEINDNYNEFCEFKFTIPSDEKEFSMHIVKNDGENIMLNQLTEYNYFIS